MQIKTLNYVNIVWLLYDERKFFFFLGWIMFMNSEYSLGRDEVIWDEVKVTMNYVCCLMHLKWKLIKNCTYFILFPQINCIAEDTKLVEIESYAEDNFVRALAMELTSKILSDWFMIKKPSTMCILVKTVLWLVS